MGPPTEPYRESGQNCVGQPSDLGGKVMDASVIGPFLSAVIKALDTMASCESVSSTGWGVPDRRCRRGCWRDR